MNAENVITTLRVQLNRVRISLSKWIECDVAVLNYRPSNGGWTSLEILEHITLTSHFLLLIIDKASVKAIKRSLTSSVANDWDGYELSPTSLQEIGIHKSFIWNRPEHMEPTGRIPLSEIGGRLNDQFNRCEGHLNVLKNGEGRLCRTTMSVNGIGKLDVYQYIYFLILHAKRHLTQLEKNRNDFETRRR